MAKVRVSDLAKKMGIPAKDLVFKLQSLGVAVEDVGTALDPSEVMAVLSGKKVQQRPRTVIVRDDRPAGAEAPKKERVVRPPRPIVAPPKRPTVVPGEPQSTTPVPIIPEFVQAAEQEAAEQERAALEAAADATRREQEPASAPGDAGSTPGESETPEARPVTPAQRPRAAAASAADARRGPTGPRAGMLNAPRPNYQGQPSPDRRSAGPGGSARPAAGPGQQRPGARPMAPGGARPAGPGGARPAGRPGAGPGGPGARPGMSSRPGAAGPGRPGMGRGVGAPPPPPSIGLGPDRRRRKDEDERPEKKKAAGKRGTRREVQEDTTDIFTKGPFSATAVLEDDLAPVPPAPEGEEATEPRRVSNRRDARRQAGPVSARVLEFKKPTGKVTLTEGMSVKELADKLEIKANDLVKHLMMKKGMMVTINAPLEPELAREIALELGIEAEIVSFEDAMELESLERMAQNETGTGNVLRAPVITVMGHVDHGKTSLLDAIRETEVAAGEAGGITQHIGAYAVVKSDKRIVFLDTPGHEAFTMMRARGAKVTDIVVLVVAADDGVMPQTKEAISHAHAAGVPMIVAINKIDKPNANLDRVLQGLANAGVLVEQYGGDVVSVQVSAITKQGIPDLLEMILLTADILDLKANPEAASRGVVLEARKETGRGIVANVLTQDGTLRIGDHFFSGSATGRVRSMMDDHGRRIEEAGPATPISVSGFDDLPNAGDSFVVVDESAQARMISELRQLRAREEQMKKRTTGMSLDQLFQKMQSENLKELNLIVKGDVQGSVEVLNDTLTKLSNEQVKINILHSSVGAISTNDVLLASASSAIVIGFNVRPERSAVELAEKEGVELRLHNVIYQLTDEMRLAMTGLLEPTLQEVFLGRAEVRDTFKVPKAGTIAGCMVIEGVIPRTASVRLLRDNVVVFDGKISSLRHFKNDVAEVRQGFECGIGIERFQDIKVGDVIEAYRVDKVAGVLQS